MKYEYGFDLHALAEVTTTKGVKTKCWYFPCDFIVIEMLDEKTGEKELKTFYFYDKYKKKLVFREIVLNN